MTKVSPALTALFAATILVVGLVACDKSPAGPSKVLAPSSPSPSEPPTAAVRVTGRVVDASGRSVAGARITLPDRAAGTPVETIADADGSGSSVRIAVAAGSETIVDVMLVGGPTGTTTLTTRLEPS